MQGRLAAADRVVAFGFGHGVPADLFARRGAGDTVTLLPWRISILLGRIVVNCQLVYYDYGYDLAGLGRHRPV